MLSEVGAAGAHAVEDKAVEGGDEPVCGQARAGGSGLAEHFLVPAVKDSRQRIREGSSSGRRAASSISS